METTDKALVVIDMQPSFDAANDEETIQNVIKAIQETKEQGFPIFVLEYCGHGDTNYDILTCLEGYDNKYFIEKTGDDGSQELMSCLIIQELAIDEFMVCGVNTCACVARTVMGLINNFDKTITVLANACNCITSCHNHKNIVPAHDRYDNQAIYEHGNCNVLLV